MCLRSRVKSTEARAQECGREQREMQLVRWLRGLSEASVVQRAQHLPFLWAACDIICQ